MRHLLPVVIVVACLSVVTHPVFVAAQENEEEDSIGLPNDKGREEVEIYCAACHSLRLVVQQGLTRKQWDELFVWMVEEQDMEPLPKTDREIMLDYLGKHIGPDSQKQRLCEQGILC
jgi:cytochrome c